MVYNTKMNKKHLVTILAVIIPVILVSAPVFSKTKKTTTPPWSHQRMDVIEDKYSCNSSKFITSWIVNKKPFKYCISVTDKSKKFYELEGLKIQIDLAVKNWLTSISQNNFDVRDKTGTKIDLTKVQTLYQENCDNDGQTLLFIFNDFSQGRYGCNLEDLKNLPAPVQAIIKKYPADPFLVIGDPDTFYRMYTSSSPSSLTAFSKTLKEVSEKASKDVAYTSDVFCEQNLKLNAGEACPDFDTSFSVITHELGHAFGLGDEYISDPRIESDQYGSGAKYLSKSIMLDCNRIWPTCDDAVGLVFMFDRTAHYKRGKVSDVCPWRKGSYVDSVQDGDWEYSNPENNKLVSKVTYKSGKPHGLSFSYFEKDAPRGCERYNSGEICGASYEYKAGKRAVIRTYKNCASDVPDCPETNN
jgi:hypothetical protein